MCTCINCLKGEFLNFNVEPGEKICFFVSSVFQIFKDVDDSQSIEVSEENELHGESVLDLI